MSDYFSEPLPKKQNNGWKIGCAVAGVIGICLLIFVLVGGLAWLLPGGSSKADNLIIELETPTADLAPGEEFSITLELTNEGSNNFTVSEVYLPSSLTENALVISVTPPGTFEGAVKEGTSYRFDVIIEPKGRETVVFNMQALKPAGIVGDIVVKVGKASISKAIHIDVRQSAKLEDEPSDILPTLTKTNNLIPYKAVVQISAIIDFDDDKIEGWTGSGTIISNDGLILTNAHVVLSDRFYDVIDLIVGITTEPDQPPEQLFYADVVQADAALDLAVIKVTSNLQGDPADFEALGIEPVKIGNVSALQLGDPIVIIGYPGIGGDTITLTRGEVSGFTYEEPYGNRAYIKTSGVIAGGNSGGLAATPAGEIIGVPSQVGSGDTFGEVVDCRRLADTNRDGVIDERDNCVPTGGFINALRPINFAIPLIEAAQAGEVAIIESNESDEFVEMEPEGDELLFDDFSDNRNNWFLSQFDAGWVDIVDKKLVINVDDENTYIYTTIPIDYDELIMVVDVDIRQAAGDGDLGFVCGYQDDENYFILEVTEDGFYKIWMLENDEAITLVEWTFSSMIPTSGPFTMAAYCGYDGFALAVNDTLLADIDDYRYNGGSVGLFSGTWAQPNIQVGFDNFAVFGP